jgi:hypothetical protein
MRENREIPYIRLGNLIYYNVPEVKQVIAERMTVRPRGRRGA